VWFLVFSAREYPAGSPPGPVRENASNLIKPNLPSPGQEARHRLSIYRQKDGVDDEFLSVANCNKTKE
jgi:hypothetical protein